MKDKSHLDMNSVIVWYAGQVYYHMDGALDEIIWLADNLKPKALKQVVDFYLTQHQYD